MLGGCIFSANYGFLADVYKKDVVTSYSGNMKENWVLATEYGTNGTIVCNIDTFSSASFRLQATTQVIGNKYKDLQFLMLRCNESLPNSVKITNIRDKKTNEILFLEKELAAVPPTWFNSSGSSPIFDPFNEIIEYENTIHRAENQGP